MRKVLWGIPYRRELDKVYAAKTCSERNAVRREHLAATEPHRKSGCITCDMVATLNAECRMFCTPKRGGHFPHAERAFNSLK